MKVAYLGIKGLPARGGAERVVEAIVTRVPQIEIRPTVYCDWRYTDPNVEYPGVKIIRLPTIPGRISRQTSLNFFAAIHALLFGDFNIIHLHHVEASFILPILRFKYSSVSTSHGLAYWRAKWGPLERRLIQLMDGPFVSQSTIATSVSRSNALYFTQKFGREVLYIPNGVERNPEVDIEEANVILDEHGLKPGQYVIFVAGRIDSTKGAHLAIEAINTLEEDLELLIVGDGSHEPKYYRSLIQTAGPNVRFQNLITNSKALFGLIAQARFLVFPSTKEAMSMVLLEAASLGTPLICSDIEENKQVLGEEAVYFESGSASSLSAKLRWAMKNSETLKRNSQRAKERIINDYSRDKIVSKYAKLYRDHL